MVFSRVLRVSAPRKEHAAAVVYRQAPHWLILACGNPRRAHRNALGVELVGVQVIPAQPYVYFFVLPRVVAGDHGDVDSVVGGNDAVHPGVPESEGGVRLCPLRIGRNDQRAAPVLRVDLPQFYRLVEFH